MNAGDVVVFAACGAVIGFWVGVNNPRPVPLETMRDAARYCIGTELLTVEHKLRTTVAECRDGTRYRVGVDHLPNPRNPR